MGTRSDVLYKLLELDLRPYLDMPTFPVDSYRPGGCRGDVLLDLPPSPSVHQVAAARLLASVCKKLRVATPIEAKELAIQRFLESNAECAKFNARGVAQLTDSRTSQEIDYYLPDIVRDISSVLYQWTMGPLESHVNLKDVLDNMAVGPGSNVGASGTSFYQKLFAGPLTFTNEALPTFYTMWLRSRPSELGLARDAEEIRASGFGPPKKVRGSVMSVADKDVTIGRAICAEPTVNMMFQRGISACIEKCLRRFCHIDISTQQAFNRRLALEGSLTLQSEDGFSTLDMKEASNRIALILLQLFRGNPEMVWLINLARSPGTQVPGVGFVPLHMISSMGNGFTFSLMTLIFCAVVKACYDFLGIPFIRNHGIQPGNFGVFGDDIIIVNRAARLVVKVLHFLGFLVNKSKSFTEGNFRESCGGDYFRGHRVTGVFIKSLQTPQDIAVALNGLIEWESRTDIPLRRTVRWLLKISGWHKGDLPLVPPYDASTAGLRVPESIALRKRNVELIQSPEGNRVIRYRRWKETGGGWRCILRKKVARLIPISSRLLSSKNKTIYMNSDGLGFSMIQGSFRQGVISLRLQRLEYHLNIGLTSVWDLIPDCDWPTSPFPRWFEEEGYVCIDHSLWTTRWTRVVEGHLI